MLCCWDLFTPLGWGDPRVALSATNSLTNWLNDSLTDWLTKLILSLSNLKTQKAFWNSRWRTLKIVILILETFSEHYKDGQTPPTTLLSIQIVPPALQHPHNAKEKEEEEPGDQGEMPLPLSAETHTLHFQSFNTSLTKKSFISAQLREHFKKEMLFKYNFFFQGGGGPDRSNNFRLFFVALKLSKPNKCQCAKKNSKQ